MISRLNTPTGRIDAIIDTDAFNEVDDQFAISYLLRSEEKINVVALYTAPFSFPHIDTERGMEESYREIGLLLNLLELEREVYRGSDRYLSNENTPIEKPMRYVYYIHRDALMNDLIDKLTK